MDKKEFMKKLSELYLEKKYSGMKGKDTSNVDKKIKELKKEYANSLIKEKKENEKYKRR